MFDLASALVLGLVLVGLVSMARSLVEGPNSERIKVVLCLVMAIVAVLLVAASDFAHDQVVLNRALDTLNFWSQMVVALLAAGIASGVWQGYKSVRNIGHNYDAVNGP